MGARCEAASRLRWLGVVFTFVAAAGASRAQEAPSPAKPNLEIIKLHWEKQVRLPRNFDPSVISTGGTFNDPASRTSSAAPSSAIDATRAATRAQSAAAGGSDGFPATPGRLPVFYIYSMKLKNVGDQQNPTRRTSIPELRKDSRRQNWGVKGPATLAPDQSCPDGGLCDEKAREADRAISNPVRLIRR